MEKILRLGIDIGSTTVKIVVYDCERDEVLFQKYQRHHAEQRKTAASLLREVSSLFPGRSFKAGVCGSGGKNIAELTRAFYVQEVVANSSAVRQKFPEARTAIELGGQDAKIIFFYYDEKLGRLMTSDMRMNGSCAGGTGAFIDEMAALLKVPVEEFESLAAKGKTVHSISGRCGVFAKTDIQGLLNQNVSREDIALSAFHAIVKQTIGGLAQGLELKSPVIFEGGPLNFNPTLVRAFSERLNLGEKDRIFPEHPDTIVALGCALAVDELFPNREGEDERVISIEESIKKLEAPVEYKRSDENINAEKKPRLYFESDEEREKWREAHKVSKIEMPVVKKGDVLDVFVGIDAGSTTSKLVFMDRDENIIDSFYSNNEGDPIGILKKGLLALHEKYESLGVKLNVLGLGSTGYGEMLVGTAFGADYHTVETVAHATAARKFMKDVSFILDIGGQDMKGIWVNDEIVTNITLNEACSSGCGSFLQNFATSLKIPLEEIADAAFSSKNPANLGSRCTVFMNSTIITEQKNGANAQDIMAGLCRSIIENVFTKVVRISDTSILGKNIMVQGGTFKNDAVLRSIEQYLNANVTRAPYPGEMGAIGVALLTKERSEGGESKFIGFDALKNFNYETEENRLCPFCANHCNRTIVKFPNGTAYITGNRCPRGESLEETPKAVKNVPDLFLMREGLLTKKYDFTLVSNIKNATIGLPRCLEFWDSLPFWTTFWRALGFEVVISDASTRAMFEKGLPFVASDTVCFPAKLVHGHIQNLAEKKVDIIFMPMIMNMPPKDTEGKSNYVCAVVKGYPLVIYNQENPEKKWNVRYEKPMFHWYSEKDRFKQLSEYAKKSFGIKKSECRKAFDQGMKAIRVFRKTLVEAGDRIRKQAKEEGKFAVVLAGRPYHTDSLVCHDLSRVFTKEGIPVLTVDSLSRLNESNLRFTRAEVTNNFHTRMLSGALISASSPELEFAQIVSFGCGHDAILSDEIIRITGEVSDKSPLILKMDEGGAANSLNIRVKSFIETISERRRRNKKTLSVRPLTDAYIAKFSKEDKKIKKVLIPNVSVAFCKLLSATLTRCGLLAEPLKAGSINEIRLGKKYVHNDTCFPAQMVIGEAISALQSGEYDPDTVAIGMAKYQGDCRLTHYSALLRRALDAAGFSNVPIVSTDPVDYKEMHPGVRLGNVFNIATVWAVVFMDIFEELRRQIRPYELEKGETDRVFDSIMERLAEALKSNTRKALSVFKKGIDEFCAIRYDRSVRKPRVFITGEYLVTFHPGSNFYVEEYLEKNGMEVILPRMINVFWKDFHSRICEMRDYKVKFPLDQGPFSYIAEGLINFALTTTERIASKHPLYKKAMRLPKLAVENNHVMERTFLSGEGWLIPGEIREFARDGVTSFVILQPFGCLPNHITGRGSMKKIKEEFPAIQILPLDLDPDTSFANVENRLQMLIMNEKSRHSENA